MTETTIVNVKKEHYDVYCGRPSLYQNDHKIGWCAECTRSHDRIDAIKTFKRQFDHQLLNGRGSLNGRQFKQAAESLRGQRLGCSCSPMRCHLEVIVDWIEKKGWYRPELTELTRDICSRRTGQ